MTINPLSKLFSAQTPSDANSRQGNGIAVFCGIVSIVTCCFSCNLAYTRYEEARTQYLRACRLIEETRPEYLKRTSERNENQQAPTDRQEPFI